MNSKIIISITSYPKRISIVSKVIESLFQQSITLDKIILWLSLQEFPEKEKCLPDELVKLNGINSFEICWVEENLKSHKKYYYALQQYPNDIVITVDDDICYSSTMVEELLNIHYEFPSAIVARNVHLILKHDQRIAEYSRWDGRSEEYRKLERLDLCAIGCGGILYPPHISSRRWFDIATIKKLSFDQDDLWLKFNEILDNISVVYTGKQSQDDIIMDAQEVALYKKNIFDNQNDVCISKLYKWSKVQNYKIVESWFNNLYQYTIYYNRLRKKLALNLYNILSINEDKKIFICGAGKYAKALVELFYYCHKQGKIEGLIVSTYNKNPKTLHNIPVILIDDLKINEDMLIICGVGEKNRQILKSYFDGKLCSWLDIDLPVIFNCFMTNSQR